MMAPVDAVEKLLAKTGWDRDKDVDLVELNEAFAVAAIAVTRQLKLNPEKVNVNGGAVALGPSDRRQRRAHLGHAAVRTAAPQPEARHCSAVPGRRQRRGARRRALLDGASEAWFFTMKYCPLCAAEYRDTVSVCSACCGAALVDSLTAPRSNSGRLLWEGTDRREFDSVIRRDPRSGDSRRCARGADRHSWEIRQAENRAFACCKRILSVRCKSLPSPQTTNENAGRRSKRATPVARNVRRHSPRARNARPRSKVDHKKDVDVSLQDALPPPQ